MNKIHKLKWSRTQSAFVVVSEIASGCAGGKAKKTFTQLARTLIYSSILLGLSTEPAIAVLTIKNINVGVPVARVVGPDLAIANAIDGAPLVDGVAQVGVTLRYNAGLNLHGANVANVTYAYLWARTDGVALTNVATNDSYVIDNGDLGGQITLTVTPSYNGVAKNNGGLTSAPTAAVADSAQNIANNISGTVAITGLAKVGENLTADITGLPNQPGMTYAYEWKGDGVGIAGATNNTYTLDIADLGKQITVDVVPSYNGVAKNNGGLTSAPTAAVADSAQNIANNISGTVAITGLAKVGENLTADITGLPNQPGMTYAYEWKGDGVGIAGATNNTYKLDIADLGKKITVDVVPSYNGVAKNNGGLTSAPTAAVADSAQNIANNISGTVAITGLAKVGENLTADITGLPNQPGMTYAYEWKGDGVGIAGATNNTYTLDIADLGKQITVDVVPSYNGVAKNNGGLTSAPTAAVADSAQNIANNISGTVAITGLAKVGENLTADITGLNLNGANAGNVTYAYVWKRAYVWEQHKGVDIAGATGKTYTLQREDIAKKITVEVVPSYKA